MMFVVNVIHYCNSCQPPISFSDSISHTSIIFLDERVLERIIFRLFRSMFSCAGMVIGKHFIIILKIVFFAYFHIQQHI